MIVTIQRKVVTMPIEVNELVKRLSDKNYLEYVLNKLDEDPDFLDYSRIKEYRKLDGALTEDSANFIVEQLRADHKWQLLASELLYYATSASITDEVFGKILQLKPTLKHICFASLAHCKLSFYQMEAICNTHKYDEAFCNLLSVYIHNNCFTTIDLQVFLANNTWAPSFSYAIAETLRTDSDITNDKKAVLERCLQEVKQPTKEEICKK